jgi:hypothetical protein
MLLFGCIEPNFLAADNPVKPAPMINQSQLISFVRDFIFVLGSRSLIQEQNYHYLLPLSKFIITILNIVVFKKPKKVVFSCLLC